MKNETQDKADFLKQYMFSGCSFEDLSNRSWYLTPSAVTGCKVEIENYGTRGILDVPALVLKSIDNLTQWDAVVVSKFLDFRGDAFRSDTVLTSVLNILDKRAFYDYAKGYRFADAIDYLRSKGYALPYKGLSVEQQVKWNWIIISEK